MWSFDIFDTCLVRRQAFPTDLFLDVAERLRKPLLGVLGADFREVFREARVEAERIALANCGHEETTLDEIWDELIELLPSLADAEGAKVELEVEADNLVPIVSALVLVDSGRREHGRVAFISDTYLPRSFIEQQLSKHGFLKAGDAIFLSSEQRLTKRSGTLFTYAIQQLGIPDSSVVHHGDNQHSDVRQASRVGLRARYLSQGLLSAHERELGQKLINSDCKVASSLVGAIRTARLSADSESDDAARSLVSTFIGPFLWVLAEWVLRRAAADGIRRLYFFSRDCHGLHCVASVLSKNLNLGIDCRYLRVSRQALLLPSVTEVTPKGIPWLRRAWERGNLSDVLGKLDIDEDEARQALSHIGGGTNTSFSLDSDERWDRMWAALGKEPLWSMLMDRISERRQSALAYFKQEGLLDDVRFGIVDLGWHQSCQAALTKLLRLAGVQAQIPAYYLALATGRGAYLPDCPAQAPFHRPPSDRCSARADFELFSRIPLMEHVLNCAPHGTVHHYLSSFSGDNGTTVVEVATSQTEMAVKSRLYRELGKFTEHCGTPLCLNDHGTRDALTALLQVASTSPLPQWATLLEALEVADDQNNRDASSMVKRRHWRDVVKDAIRGRDFFSLSSNVTGVWPELSLVGSGHRIAHAYRRLEQVGRVRRFIKSALIG